MIAATKNDAAEKHEDEATESYDEDDNEDDVEYDDDDVEEDKTIKQTVCGRDVEVMKLVADIEFMVLVDK